MSGYHRIEGWERRFQTALDGFRGRPYALGQSDCFRLACANLEALTGVDRWPEFAGRYATRREALRLLAQYGGSFDDAASGFFDVPPSPIGFARRGDIVKIVDAAGESHLGVCIGSAVAEYRETGIGFRPRHACQHCWMIG